AGSINPDDNYHVLLGDMGGTLGIDQELKGRRNPGVTAMNYMGYNFAVLNHRDLSNVSKLRRAVGFARYPFMNCNIGHPNTKEPFFGEPYKLIDINGMRLAYVSGYAGEFDAGEDDLFRVTGIAESLRRTLRYIYDNKDPDYVIVAISDWDESMQEVVNSLEGDGIVVTGAPEVYGEKADAGADHEAGAEIQLLSRKETYNVDESNPISMYHHHHDGFVMSIDLNFKRRTTTFEYRGHTRTRLDKEISNLTDDIHLNDLIYYHF